MRGVFLAPQWRSIDLFLLLFLIFPGPSQRLLVVSPECAQQGAGSPPLAPSKGPVLMCLLSFSSGFYVLLYSGYDGCCVLVLCSASRVVE